MEDGNTSSSGASSGKMVKGGGSNIGDGECSGCLLLLGILGKVVVLGAAGGALGVLLADLLRVCGGASSPPLCAGSCSRTKTEGYLVCLLGGTPTSS